MNPRSEYPIPNASDDVPFVPGCYSGGDPNWCPDESRWWHCNGYPPERLGQMLQVQLDRKPDRYNEIVLDVAQLTRLWPAGIEAVVYPRSSAEVTRKQAEDLLTHFREAYGEAAREVALLEVDLSEGVEEPFTARHRREAG